VAGALKALLRLYYVAIKALLRRYKGFIKAPLAYTRTSSSAMAGAPVFFFCEPVSGGLSTYQTHALKETAGAGEFLAGVFLWCLFKGLSVLFKGLSRGRSCLFKGISKGFKGISKGFKGM
jgi:hypothetical protein